MVNNRCAIFSAAREAGARYDRPMCKIELSVRCAERGGGGGWVDSWSPDAQMHSCGDESVILSLRCKHFVARLSLTTYRHQWLARVK